jgi:protein gp37
MTATRQKILQRTAIEWTDFSWNPIHARDRNTGKIGWHCEHASEECRLCYAETINKRVGTKLAFTRPNRSAVEVFLDEAWMDARMPPGPAKIFVCDMTDLFAEFVPDEWIARIVTTALRNPLCTFQVLTKRPERMRAFFAGYYPKPIRNLWLGTSIGERRQLDRLDLLRATPAVSVRFVSCEPLLEDLGRLQLRGIGWVIVGAESDARKRARPMQLDWVRHIRDQCVAAGIPFFFKQDAERGKKLPTPELDGRQWREFPIIGGRGPEITG